MDHTQSPGFLALMLGALVLITLVASYATNQASVFEARLDATLPEAIATVTPTPFDELMYFEEEAVIEEPRLMIACPAITAGTDVGSRDSDDDNSVSQLQLFLARYYQIEESDIVTGYFGERTQDFLAQFQMSSGLEPEAKVTLQTLDAIFEICDSNLEF